MLVPDLRPLSVGEIIDVAIKIWRRHLPTLARIVIVVIAPLQVLSALVMASVNTSETDFETFDSEGNPIVDSGELAGWLAGMLTAQAISALAFLIASAAVLRAVSVAYLGGAPQWRESLRAVTGRLGSLIWLGFLMTAGLGLAALAFVVPAIWLGVAWSIAFPVLIAEGQKGTGALRRAFHLVRGRWWPTFGALLLAFMFEFFVGLVIGLPLGFLTANWDSDSLATLAVSTVVSVASSVITTPFMAAVLVLIYFDLRVRKEGFDLELLAQGVGVPGGSVPGQRPWNPDWAGARTGWTGPGDGWPAPSGGAHPPTPPPAGGWGAPGGPWAPPGSGVPPARPGPPPAPIDPTGGWGPPPMPPAGRDDEQPAGPADRRPAGPGDEQPAGPADRWPAGPGDERPAAGEQTER